MRFKRIRRAPACWRARASCLRTAEPVVAVTAEQNGVLRAAVTTLLNGIGDVAVTLERGNWREARRLRSRFDSLLRLLDDLGWSPLAEPTAITMPADELTRAIRAISVYAVERIAGETAAEEESKRRLRHLTEICATCTAAHAQIVGEEA